MLAQLRVKIPASQHHNGPARLSVVATFIDWELVNHADRCCFLRRRWREKKILLSNLNLGNSTCLEEVMISGARAIATARGSASVQPALARFQFSIQMVRIGLNRIRDI